MYLLEENMGVILRNFGLGNDFLNMIPKIQASNTKGRWEGKQREE